VIISPEDDLLPNSVTDSIQLDLSSGEGISLQMFSNPPKSFDYVSIYATCHDMEIILAAFHQNAAS
jgi:hypothetical protein